ncbi:MAG TPA: hypothetical protein VIE43_11995, partial [Thermoanaerobaculia bacterium]|nr:hypothetical protein [Thermoanaerobaculia bacterium]
MELIVRQGEREEKVRVRRVDGGYEVTVGDRAYSVDALAPRPGLLSLRIDQVSNQVNKSPGNVVAQHEVAVRPQGEETYWVSTADAAGPVEV